MLLPSIKRKVELKFGAPIRYAKDAEALAATMRKVCKCQISGSTIKRLFGIIKGTDSPRLWTLDLIAFYLGHTSYNDLINDITDNKPTKKLIIESLYTHKLSKGSTYKIECGKTSYLIIENTNKDQFLLHEQKKTILLPEDILEIEKIQLHFPIVIKAIKRNDMYYDGVLIGNVTGVTSITALKSKPEIKNNNKSLMNSQP